MDKPEWENAKCEVCGEKAVAQVFDMAKRQDLRTGAMKARHFGKPHLFCEEHKRESIWYELAPIDSTDEAANAEVTSRPTQRAND